MSDNKKPTIRGLANGLNDLNEKYEALNKKFNIFTIGTFAAWLAGLAYFYLAV